MLDNKQFLPISEQQRIVETLKLFRNKYLCQYGEILEHLCFKLQNEQNTNNRERLISSIHEIMTKFTKIHVQNIQYADINKWECFFNVFNIPISADLVEIESLTYCKSFFIMRIRIRYGYQIGRKSEKGDNIGTGESEVQLVSHLQRLGYKIYEDGDLVKIGYEFSYDLPYSFEEQVWFHAKYLINYNLFVLWNNICGFRNKQKNSEFGHPESSKSETSDAPQEFYKWDEKIPKTLKNIVRNLFIVRFRNFPMDIKFRFTLDGLSKNDVDIIYNKYLFAKIKDVEQKLRKYMHLRYALTQMSAKSN